MGEISSYKDLKVWQVAMDVAVAAYQLTKPFPASGTYGMTSQIRRSAASIAANIAEGHGRENSGLFVQALRYAQGSLKELETHVALAVRVELCPLERATGIMAQCDELGRMLRSFIRSIQNQASQ